MAKSSIRANLLLKLSVDRDQRTVQPIETGGRISYLFKTFFNKTLDKLKTNIVFALIFALPLFFLCFVFPSLIDGWTIKTYNFIGNFGIGYPGVADSLAVAYADKFSYFRLYLFPCLAPAIILFFVGLAGLFHCSRGILWGEKVKPIKSFFNGIRQLWKPFLITGVIVAALTEGVCYGSLWHIQMMLLGNATVGSWFLFIILLIIAFLAVCVLIFLLPTFACYRFSYLQSLKNAILLDMAMLPTTLIIAVFSIGIILLSLIGSFVGYLLLVFFLTLGVYFYAAMWTDYGQYNFDSFILPQYSGQGSGNKNVTKTLFSSKKDKKGAGAGSGYVGAVSKKAPDQRKQKKNPPKKTNSTYSANYKKKK